MFATDVSRDGIAIETEELWRVYKVGPQEVPALRGVNLRIESGQFVAVKGRSGSGKTTLLNCIGGSITPRLGSCTCTGATWPG